MRAGHCELSSNVPGAKWKTEISRHRLQKCRKSGARKREDQNVTFCRSSGVFKNQRLEFSHDVICPTELVSMLGPMQERKLTLNESQNLKVFFLLLSLSFCFCLTFHV